MTATGRLRKPMLVVVAGALVAAAVAVGPEPLPARAADPTSSFYYESEIDDGIGIGRTGYGQTGDPDFVAGPFSVEIPQTPYVERISLRLDLASGEKLVAGQTYTGGVLRLESGGVRHRICNDPVTSAHYVHDVGYDEDEMTFLAMSSSVACGSGGTFHAEVRWNTVAPAYAGVIESPNRYDRVAIPSVAIGGHSDKSWTLRAVGSKPLAMGTPVIGGADPAPYSTVNDACRGQTLNPGETCTFDVRFSPTARGGRSADVSISANTPSGHRDIRVTSVGQVATTTSLSMPKGPHVSKVAAKTRVQPRPDDLNGMCLELVLTGKANSTSPHPCDEDGRATFWPDPPNGRYKVEAVSIETQEFASSSSEPRWARWVGTMGNWGTSKVTPSKFFPHPDGYLDQLIVSGNRKQPIAVDIVITHVASGAIVAEASLPLDTGEYRWTWNGKPTGEAELAASGTYDVAVTLTEDEWTEQTFHHEIKLSQAWVKWTTKTAALRGDRYGPAGTSKDASISQARSDYPIGVRLGSGKGVAVVEYAFPVASSNIYGWMSFGVKGRSPNRHKAMLAIWNPKLGSYWDLANFDASKAVGPRYRWWKTGVSGEKRVRNGKVRAAVMVWKGLGRTGPAVFDINKVRLTYRVGKLMAPVTTSDEVRASAGPATAESHRAVGPRLSRRLVGQALPPLETVPDEASTPGEPAEPAESRGLPDGAIDELETYSRSGLTDPLGERSDQPSPSPESQSRMPPDPRAAPSPSPEVVASSEVSEPS